MLVSPFARSGSNVLETLSLGVLNIISVLNLVKATFVEAQAVPVGYIADLFLLYDWVELVAVGIFPVLVLAVINLAILVWLLRKLPVCWRYDFFNRNPFEESGEYRLHIGLVLAGICPVSG